MPRTVKILHILHAFSHGGLENGLVNIINGSPDDLDHELCLITRSGEFIHRLKKPVRYYELHKRPGNSLKSILQLRQVIRASRAHIVHTRNWGAFDGVIAASLCPDAKVIHGEHGRDISDPEGTNARRNLARRVFSRRIARFTAVSEDLAHWLAATVRIPREKIQLIRNGVDTDRYRPRKEFALRQEFGIAQDEFVIGTISRLDPVKNHVGLVQAFAQLAKKFRKLRLIIVGDGPERTHLESIIRDSDAPVPILTGYRSDVEKFYGLFDVFVLNSLAEGMSNSLLEALASALPVVCTPVGGNSELVIDGKHGCLVPAGSCAALADAIEGYIVSPGLCSTHGANARRFITDNYSLPSMIERYVGLYRGLSGK